MRNTRPHLLFALGLALAIGCGANGKSIHNLDRDSVEPVAVATAHPKAFFIPGEQMRWKISIRSIVGGQMTLAVGNPGTTSGKNIVYIVSRVESAGLVALFTEVNEDLTTSLNIDTGSPANHTAIFTDDHSESKVEASYAPGSISLESKTAGGKTSISRRTIAADSWAHNTASALLAIRGWDAKPGERMVMHLMAQYWVWRASAMLSGVEDLETDLGTFRARRIDGIAVRLKKNGSPDSDIEERRFSMWFSDDDQRIPLRIIANTKYGEAKLELVEFHTRETSLSAETISTAPTDGRSRVGDHPL